MLCAANKREWTQMCGLFANTKGLIVVGMVRNGRFLGGLRGIIRQTPYNLKIVRLIYAVIFYALATVPLK